MGFLTSKIHDIVNSDSDENGEHNDQNDNTDQNQNGGHLDIVKKALLIGINYEGQNGELSGCINDSINLKQFMIAHDYFDDDEFTMLNDHQQDNLKPTRANILSQFKSIVDYANSPDNANKEVYLFISYSGHGSYLKDYDGDEEDGRDEVLCPIDYSNNGFISDDEIKNELINKLPSNAKLFVLIDACHSGTMCDLKYNYMVDKKSSYRTYGDFNDSNCHVIMISGCRDDQTSADAYVYDTQEKHYEYQGAMSASFIANFHDNSTYQELIDNMRKWLKEHKFDQIPQLSSGRYINIKGSCLLTDFDSV